MRSKIARRSFFGSSSAVAVSLCLRPVWGSSILRRDAGTPEGCDFPTR